MDIIKINQELYDAAKRLEASGSSIFQLGNAMAKTERDYRVALQQAILTRKAEGMSVTLISDLARGDTADLKLQRDAAEAQYKSAIEAQRSLQTVISALQSIAKYQSDL